MIKSYKVNIYKYIDINIYKYRYIYKGNNNNTYTSTKSNSTSRTTCGHTLKTCSEDNGGSSVMEQKSVTQNCGCEDLDV